MKSNLICKLNSTALFDVKGFMIQKYIGLTPLIALIYVSVEPAVTQNCVASVTNKWFKKLVSD